MNAQSSPANSRYFSTFSILFFLWLTADIAVMYFGEPMWRWATKPFLMPLLLVWFLVATKSVSSSGKHWIVLAVVFSWAGDVLLMLDHLGSQFFILGLVSFLSAHVFYCLYFIKRARSVPGLARVLVAAYAVVLLYLLYPHLGSMLAPVVIYTAVISSMLLLALAAHNTLRLKATVWMAVGAFFFVISDSCLAINKFHTSFALAGLAVMGTYGLAQFLIVAGAIAEAKPISKTAV